MAEMAQSNGVVAQGDTGRPRQCAGRLHAVCCDCATGCAIAAGEDAPITPFVLTLRLLIDRADAPPDLQLDLGGHRRRAADPRPPAVHLGFGVAAPRGLLVPVVSDAQDKTTRELAAAVAELIGEARDGHAQARRTAGLDVHGVQLRRARDWTRACPVINYPEAAILGMGSLKPRPVVVDGAVVVAADDDIDLCLRPSHRRRRAGGRHS